MRKFISLVLAFSILLSLSACVGKDKPDTVVNSFCKAMQKFDFDGMAACTMEGTKAVDISSGDSDELTNQLIEYLSSAASKMTYSIEESETLDQTAIVTVKYNYVDATPIFTAAIGEYFQQALALAFSGANEDTMAQLFRTIFTEKVESVSASTSEVTVTFGCSKTEDGWKIANVPEDALNVLTCNIYSAFDSLRSSFEDNMGSIGEDGGEDEYVWHDIHLGEEVELATIRIRLTEVTESKELNSELSNVTAPEGTKFVLFTTEIENITKSPFSFSNDLSLYDNQGRSYNSYEDAVWYADNSFTYVELAPNIRQTGTLIYNVPNDCVGYYLVVSKSGTNEAYRLLSD